MNNKHFAHLHVHDQYSQLDGYGTAKQFVSKAKDLGFQYLGLTNHGNIDGLIKFQKECDKQGILPVSGCELYTTVDMKDKEKPSHMTVLIKNEKGFKTLCKLLSYANLTGFYRKPRVSYSLMLEEDLSGLIILSGCLQSFIVNQPSLIPEFMKKTDVYLEIMPHDISEQIAHNMACIEWSVRYNTPLVATNDCHYINKGDEHSQEVLLAIQRKAKWNDKNRWRFDLDGLHLRTADEMAKAFDRQGLDVHFSAMRNTITIAKQCCDFRIKRRKISLPEVTKYGDDPDDAMYKICHARFYEMFGEDGVAPREYGSRFDEEFKLISKKKFSKYFLIVKEIVDWCDENDIMVGPGRGSVGGSLLAYLMGITKVDPIRYHLPFSRFISEDRIDWPDIDIDIERVKRPLVKQHIQDLYGKYSTCGISTFLKMKGRAVIRDVGRVFDLPDNRVDEFAKSIKRGEHESESISHAVQDTDIGKDFEEDFPEETKTMIALEGQVKGSGQHAAAMIIHSGDLLEGDRTNLCKRSGVIVTNWDMEDSEFVGLMKLDVLGLSTLSVLSEAKRLIGDSSFTYTDIPLDDENVFSLILQGETAGLFQISAGPTSRLCRDTEVGKFEDIVAAIALVRPGPLDSGITSEYIERKVNKKHWRRRHPIYEKITADTYGIPIYQEQIMQIISKIAGLPESTADKIRKVIGKKRDPKEFVKFKNQFVDGCKKEKTFSPEEAEGFWEDLQHWARYGFNRAHSVEYAMIAYWTAWLKVNHPIEFYCATLTYGEYSGSSGDKSKQRVVDELLEKGYKIIPSKIGISDPIRWVAHGNTLYIPFSEIMGVGEKDAEKCIALKQKKQKMKGFFYDSDTVEQTALECLIFDDIHALDLDYVEPKVQKHYNFNFLTESDEEMNVLTRLRFRNNNVKRCRKCDLIHECNAPVLPSMGIFNVPIIAEAPGEKEDEEGKGLIGPAGQLLWEELGRHRLKRELFHITNCCKCFPSKTKTPKPEHINACYPWLEKELTHLQPPILLGIGNVALFALTGQKNGITALSGTYTWSSEFNCSMFWCIHPSAVLRRRSNEATFVKGIKAFADMLSTIMKNDDIPF